jgi:hypothetical protein
LSGAVRVAVASVATVTAAGAVCVSAGQSLAEGAASTESAALASRIGLAPRPVGRTGQPTPVRADKRREDADRTRRQRRAADRPNRGASRSALRPREQAGPAESRRVDAGLPLARGDEDGRAGLVSHVQQRLGIAAGGHYGPTTAQAVKQYQAVHDPRGHRVPRGRGLPVTGVVGPRTWHSLQASLQVDGRWLPPRRIANAVGAPQGAVARQWPRLDRTLQRQHMDDVGDRIAVLATVLTEVGPRLRPVNEHGDPGYFARLYDGRADLGNLNRGDGARFHGRGYIQLTGRSNYRTYGRRIDVPLERRPDLALRPAVGARVLTEYFKEHRIPSDARRGDWRGVRREVNGGLNGWSTYRRHVAELLRASAR